MLIMCIVCFIFDTYFLQLKIRFVPTMSFCVLFLDSYVLQLKKGRMPILCLCVFLIRFMFSLIEEASYADHVSLFGHPWCVFSSIEEMS